MTLTLMIAAVQVEPGWAVGAVTLSDPTIDRDVLLDADGHPWIPGSALAGSLRAHLAAANPSADERLMGSRPPRDRAESLRSTVSPLWIVGAMFAPESVNGVPPEGMLETVGQTAIDRQRGAAASRSLRMSRLAASSGLLTIYMRHDSGDSELTPEDLQLIARWRPAIGRDRTRGSGRARLLYLRHGRVDPATAKGAVTWLTHTGPALFESVATGTITAAADDTPWLEEELQIVDGLLVGSSLPEKIATSRKRNGRPLIPGSAWKGLIRARAEFIIRSRYGEDAVCRAQTGCGTCAVCGVFGHQSQRGALAFRDSYVEFGDAGPDGGEVKRTQVAIDRVTGGARDALWFDIAPITAGRVHLRIDKLAPVEPWVRNIIRHVLRDIDDGIIGAGSRSTRGLGTLRLSRQPDDLKPVVLSSLENPPAEEPMP